MSKNGDATHAHGSLEQFAQHILNGLSAHIAIVDAIGDIIAVNTAWQQFAIDNPPINTNVSVGANYLAVCDAAKGADAKEAATFAAGLRSVLAGEQTYFQLEYPCHAPDEQRWFIGRITQFKDEHGSLYAIVAHENTTVQKLAQINLSKFARAVEQAPVSVLFTNENGVIEYVNPKLGELSGYGVEELLGQLPSIFKSGHTSLAEYKQLWETITGGQEWHGEFLNRKKDGSMYWESASISPLKNESGQVTNFVAVKKDITEQKQAEAILRESSQRYQALFENARDAIFVNDMNGRFLDANDVACKRLEYSLSELKQMRMADIDPIEFGNLKPERINPLNEESYAFFETLHVTKSGKSIPTEIGVQHFQYGAQKALLSIARDISERVRVVKAERKAREFAEALANMAVIINKSLNIDHVLTQILNNLRRIILFEMGTIMLNENEFAQIVATSSDIGSQVSDNIMGMRLKIAEFSTLNYMLNYHEGILLPIVSQYSDWVEMPATQNIHSYVGMPICVHEEVIGFINLTSSQYQAFSPEDLERLKIFADHAAIAVNNARLFESMEKLQASLEEQVQIRSNQLKHEKEFVEAIIINSPNVILYSGLNGAITLANSKFYDTFNLTKSEVMGRKLTEVLMIQQSAMFEEKFAVVSRTGETEKLDSLITLKDGSTLDVEFRMAPVKNGEISGIVHTIRNMTPYKIAERAKDSFVSNVSHELKSPITSIQLHQQLIRRNPQNLDRYLTRIERDAERLNQLIEDLLYLSKLDQNRIECRNSTFELNQIISNLIEDREAVATEKHLSVNFENPHQSVLIQADRSMVAQVLSLLLTNAMNFTPEGGQIAFKTHLVTKNDSNWCGVEIRDTGLGILPEEQSKIFERFYRGKASVTCDCPGTGLGLAIASEIIARHQGEIEVHSDGVPGKGGVFTIWLPTQL